jgi:hypothetical protein
LLEKLAQILLKKEILFQQDLEEILGKGPYEIKNHEVAGMEEQYRLEEEAKIAESKTISETQEAVTHTDSDIAS